MRPVRGERSAPDIGIPGIRWLTAVLIDLTSLRSEDASSLARGFTVSERERSSPGTPVREAAAVDLCDLASDQT